MIFIAEHSGAVFFRNSVTGYQNGGLKHGRAPAGVWGEASMPQSWKPTVDSHAVANFVRVEGVLA